MRQGNVFRTLIFGFALAITLTFSAGSLRAQTRQTKPSITPTASNAAPHNWTAAQLIPLTVSQAWQLSGRNEADFFDIVQQLAEISAKNRGLTLPDTAAAGQKAGAYIKRTAKADHQQLLYEIVDKAVQYVGKAAPEPKSAN